MLMLTDVRILLVVVSDHFIEADLRVVGAKVSVTGVKVLCGVETEKSPYFSLFRGISKRTTCWPSRPESRFFVEISYLA